jgi:peptide/nickel transport system permease protein
MSVDISAASDELAVLTAAAPPPPPDDQVLASRHLETGRYGNLVAGLRQIARKPIFVIALLYVVFVIVSAVFPSWFSTGQPYATHPADASLSPSFQHLFGTDQLGRDLWTRVLYGSSLTIEATITAIAIGLVAGLSLGVLSGFFGGWVDAVIMRIVDVLLAIPALLFALTIVTAVGYGTLPVALAIGLGVIPGFARTTRAEVLRVKTQPYVEASRASGASWGRVLIRHVLPNSWGPVAVLAVLDAGVAIIAIASLSFLGFGAPPPSSEWGTLISDGRDFLVTSWWLSLMPGIFVTLLVLSLNHISKTLQELER